MKGAELVASELNVAQSSEESMVQWHWSYSAHTDGERHEKLISDHGPFHMLLSVHVLEALKDSMVPFNKNKKQLSASHQK